MQRANFFLAECAFCIYPLCILQMITTIQLSITEGPSLPASKLEKLVKIAAAAGKTPDEYLAEMITREVDGGKKPRKSKAA